MSQKSYRALLVLIVACSCINKVESAPLTTISGGAVTSSFKLPSIPSTESPSFLDLQQDFPSYPRQRKRENKNEQSDDTKKTKSKSKSKADAKSKAAKARARKEAIAEEEAEAAADAAYDYYIHADSSDESYEDFLSHNYKDGKPKKATTTSKAASTSTSPSSTVVTTVVVVSTGTPTAIYSDNSSTPARQQGNNQTDPNYPQDGNDNYDDDPLLQDLSRYHKLVVAFSIVGSIVGVALLIAGFIIGRRRLRNKKKKQLDKERQLEDQAIFPLSRTPSKSSSTLHGDQPPPPPPPPAALIPSASTSLARPEPVLGTTKNESAIFASPFVPTQYTDFRRNQTLSIASQTTPSAPSAKELDHMQYSHSFLDTHFMGNDMGESRAESSASAYGSSMARRAESRHPSFCSTDLPPPPAYTPSATPSAPPLYILPTAPETDEQTCSQLDNTALRRHSITLVDNTSEPSQSIPLRRGSGSVARLPTSP
ncbi:hypothetical protein BD560DRAFT_395611 [Blakeslea trispora]|nr:hypothetical protein BD560DRAFT_395611 [Blakeslea trispora]